MSDFSRISILSLSKRWGLSVENFNNSIKPMSIDRFIELYENFAKFIKTDDISKKVSTKDREHGTIWNNNFIITSLFNEFLESIYVDTNERLEALLNYSPIQTTLFDNALKLMTSNTSSKWLKSYDSKLWRMVAEKEAFRTKSVFFSTSAPAPIQTFNFPISYEFCSDTLEVFENFFDVEECEVQECPLPVSSSMECDVQECPLPVSSSMECDVQECPLPVSSSMECDVQESSLPVSSSMECDVQESSLPVSLSMECEVQEIVLPVSSSMECDVQESSLPVSSSMECEVQESLQSVSLSSSNDHISEVDALLHALKEEYVLLRKRHKIDQEKASREIKCLKSELKRTKRKVSELEIKVMRK
jgi:hypothetical protein